MKKYPKKIEEQMLIFRTTEMARRARLDMAGFHHIVNRGVARYLNISSAMVSKVFRGVK